MSPAAERTPGPDTPDVANLAIESHHAAPLLQVQRFFFPYQPAAADVKRFPIGYRFTPEEWPELYAVHVWRNKRRKMGMLAGLE